MNNKKNGLQTIYCHFKSELRAEFHNRSVLFIISPIVIPVFLSFHFYEFDLFQGVGVVLFTLFMCCLWFASFRTAINLIKSVRKGSKYEVSIVQKSKEDCRIPSFWSEFILGSLLPRRSRVAVLGDAAEQFAKRIDEGWSSSRATLHCYIFPIRDQIWPFLRRALRKVPVFGRLVG